MVVTGSIRMVEMGTETSKLVIGRKTVIGALVGEAVGVGATVAVAVGVAVGVAWPPVMVILPLV